MEYLVICLAALIASGLTLFSGFGLGTLLMPVFALFFPVEVAIGLTAIVHFLNNIFKLALMGRYADRTVVLKFGLPAIASAFLGAWLLILLSDLEPWATYRLLGREFAVMPVKAVIALLMIFFASLELLPGAEEKIALERKYLPIGGILSGFFGGLSGNQGALRSAFLVRSGLAKEAFIATGVVTACMVDFTRLFVYGAHLAMAVNARTLPLLLAATASAFLGVFIGSRLVKKVTMRAVRILVSVMLFSIAVALGFGII